MNRFLLWTLVLTSSLVFGQAGDYQFTASSGTFIAINSSDTVSEIHADSRLSNTIPIGFNFTFDGITYSHLKASSNSFITFDTTSTNSRTSNDLDNVNEPILAPVWDDNDGRATGGSNASYLVTGVSPNRIFTMEWLNWEWRWLSSTETISYQVKLYETSNKIEFIYRPEMGTVTSGTASIGICGLGTGAGTFLSLDGFGTSPNASSTVETFNINAKPVSGQTYTFTTPTCPPPASIVSTSTNTSTSISFNANSATFYEFEYGVENYTFGTTTRTTTSSNPFTINGLTSATEYDVYIRNICGMGDTSSWTKSSFSTLYNTPLLVDFIGFNGNNLSGLFDGWSEANNWPSPTGTTSSWNTSSTAQATALGAATAKINLYTTSAEEWIISPRFMAIATDIIDFKAAVTSFNGTGTNAMGSDDSVSVLVSTDGGTSWSLIMAFDSVSNLTNSLTSYNISIGAYAGQAINVAFYAQDGPIDDAEDYDFHIADLFIGTPPSLDMKANSAYTLNSCLSSSEPIYAIIENNSGSTIDFSIDNAIVNVEISNQVNTILSATLNSDTLAGGDTLHVLVGNTDMSATGTYDMRSFVTVSGDGITSNDTSTIVQVDQDSTYTTPQEVDFVGYTGANISSIFSGWQEANTWPNPSGTSSLWDIGNGAQITHFGYTTAKVNLFTDNRNEWILSPKMTVTSTDSIFFKAGITDYNSASSGVMGSDDSVKVLVSTDCGLSWNQVFVFTSLNQPGNSLSTYKIDLGAYVGSDIIVAFYAQDGPVDDAEDYDFHIADLFIGTPPTNDVGVSVFLSPNNDCGNDSTEVKIVVSNYGIGAQNNVGVTVDISGSSTITLSTIISSLGVGVEDTIVVGSFNTLLGGTFDLSGYTTLVGDEDNSNDTTKITGIAIGAIPNSPTIVSPFITICEGKDTMLVANGSTTNYRWYNTSDTLNPVFVGDTLYLSNVTVTDTIEVEGFNLAAAPIFGATTVPISGFVSPGAGYGVAFDVNIPEVIIDSVTMYPTGSGWVIVHVADYSGTALYSSDTIFIVGVNNLTETRVPVNLTVPYGVGVYKMTMSYGGGITNMGRNSQTFPFVSAGGEVSIIGGSTGTGIPTSANNYWFYDWSIIIPSCPSLQAIAVLTVNPRPVTNQSINYCGDSTMVNGNMYYTSQVVYDTLSGALCDSIVITNLTIEGLIDITTTVIGSSIVSNQIGATYQWIDCDNGNVAINGETDSTYTATTNGNYAVVITMGSCSDTSTCVNIIGLGVNKNTFGTNINIFPNPTTGNVTIDLGDEIKEASISIITITGKVVYTQSNVNESQLNVSLIDFSKGVYFVKVRSNNQQKVIKLIKK